ncbi:MAG: hypothetical protein H2212_00040 [Ruminococcus sp.]|nr:hypothetical protein [Ruminococcus sp.]
MWTIIFIVTTIICGIGWITGYISCTAMIYYMKKTGYKLPNDEEIKECTRFVVRHFIK